MNPISFARPPTGPRASATDILSDPASTGRLDRWDYFVAAALATVLIGVLIPFAPLGVDPHHDGVMIKPALDVLAGQVLFRDTFTQYGALTTYLHALALWIHPSLLSLKIFTALIYAAALPCLYFAWRQFLPRGLAVMAGVFFVIFFPCYEAHWGGVKTTLLPWSSVVALLFQAIGFLALLLLIRGRNPRNASTVLGFTCACVFWARMPVGVTMTGGAVVILAALFATGWKPITSWSATVGPAAIAFLAVNAAFLLGLVAQGALGDWWYQNIEWPRKWAASGADTVLENNWHAYFPSLAQAVAVIGGTLLCLSGSYWLRRRPQWRRAGLLLPLAVVVLALGIWTWEFWQPIVTVRKAGWGLIVPLAILAATLWATWRCLRNRQAAEPRPHLLAAAGGFAVASLPQYFPVADPWHVLWALGPGFGVAIWALWRASGARPALVTTILALSLVPLGVARIHLARAILSERWTTLEAPALVRGMRVSPHHARFYAALEAAFQRVRAHRPDITATMIGHSPLPLCFAPDLTNATALTVAWPGLTTAESEAQRWSYVASHRPLVLFEQPNWAFVDRFYRESNYAPLLYYHELAFEIAAPVELLKAAGVPAGGIPLPSLPP